MMSVNDFDANKPLPKQINLNSVENHLHRIGLVPTSVRSKKRLFLYNPFWCLASIF